MTENEEGIVVLSLFDGMSCGQIALERAGIKVKTYFASEIKKHAIEVTQRNYPKTIQLGDVTKIDGGGISKIDLLIGGSPCQDFSRANSVRDGLNGLKSMLFYQFIRLLEETKPKYFLLENVIMDQVGYATISNLLGTEPVRICGSRVSGALRDRLYWTNIGDYYLDIFGGRHCSIPQPPLQNILLQDVLEYGFADTRKHNCLNTWYGNANYKQDYLIRRNLTTGMVTLIYNTPDCNPMNGVRTVNRVEMERLHNIPNGYTTCVTEKQAGNLIGDGWTVDVIAHIFSFMV